MIPNDQPLRKQTIERMLNYLARQDDLNLSKWEEDFLESINDQFLQRGDLSTKQCEILERLYDK